ncbi:hypothetical protein ACTTAI_19100 [Rhodobacter capsulatus]|uniref:hypothetical protein n=1 Tax=Rhodobacter capsulatus TaxID=1061 RepID=UPI0040297C5C
MKFEIYSADSFRLRVPVRRGGVPMPLTGASVEASASNGVRNVQATIDMSFADDGVIGVILGKGALSAGIWQLDVRVTVGPETQTVRSVLIDVTQSA